MAARIASQHYASSEDIKEYKIENIVPVISQSLDNMELGAPPIAAPRQSWQDRGVICVALFGYDPVIPPDLPAELEMQAKKAGVKIFV